jgi:hypothetical protein
MWRYAVSIVSGAALSLAIMGITYQFFPTTIDTRTYDRDSLTFNGVLDEVDLNAKTVTIWVKGSFPDFTSVLPKKVRFTYDDETWWGSRQFLFKDGVYAGDDIQDSSPHVLPAGTYVSIRRDNEHVAHNRVDMITYLRRLDL